MIDINVTTYYSQDAAGTYPLPPVGSCTSPLQVFYPLYISAVTYSMSYLPVQRVKRHPLLAATLSPFVKMWLLWMYLVLLE